MGRPQGAATGRWGRGRCGCGIVFERDSGRQGNCRLCRERYDRSIYRRHRPGNGAGDPLRAMLGPETDAEDALWPEIIAVYRRARAKVRAEEALLCDANTSRALQASRTLGVLRPGQSRAPAFSPGNGDGDGRR